MGRIVIDDFGGGVNMGDAEKIAGNQSAVLEHFMHTDRNLRSFDGRVLLNSTEIEAGGTVFALWRLRVGDTSYTLVQLTQDIYLDLGSGTPRFRPIVDIGLNTYGSTAVVFGSAVYIAGENTGLRRWDAFYYTTGTAACAGATTAVTGTGTGWVAGAVRKGDSIWFYVSGAWDGPYYIAAIGSATAITLTANGPNTGGAVPYIISRQHLAGVDPPGGTVTAAAVGSGGSIQAGDYQYAVTLYNSVTGYESNPTYVSGTVTCVNSDSVTVGGYTTSYNTFETRLQADTLRVYRTKAFGGIFYLAGTLARDQAGYAFASTYTDTVADSALDDGTTVPEDHDCPPQGGYVFVWKRRLWAFDPTAYWASLGTYTSLPQSNVIMFSTMNRPEYWPLIQLGLDDPLSIDVTKGGYAYVGADGDSLYAALPAEGVVSQTGTEGESLLLLPSSGMAHRLYGSDWSDFRLEEAFRTTCVSRRAAVNADGVLLWVTEKGLCRMDPADGKPTDVHDPLFPMASRSFRSQVTAATSSTAYKMAIVGAYWDGFFIVAWPLTPSTTNNRAFLYHVASGTYTTLDNTTNPLAARCFAVFDGPYDNNKLYCGLESAAYIWELFAKTGSNTYWTPATTTGVACAWTSLMYYGGAAEAEQAKVLREVYLCFQRPASDQTVTLTVLLDGATTGTARSATLSSSGSKARAWVRYINLEDEMAESAFQIKVSGTFTVPVVLERAVILYRVAGPGR